MFIFQMRIVSEQPFTYQNTEDIIEKDQFVIS